MIDDRLYSAILRSLEQTHCACMWFCTWVTSFYSAFFVCVWNIHRIGVLATLAWLVPHETAAVSAQVLCTPYNHAPCHFMQSHIRKVYACLAVTCHLHFWQNDRDLLRATAVTRGWNGYRNKSQHRKSTLEKKIIPPFQHVCMQVCTHPHTHTHICAHTYMYMHTHPLNHTHTHTSPLTHPHTHTHTHSSPWCLNCQTNKKRTRY